ncbi:Smr/MutS family protein [Paracoccus caeni]|uniref:Smr/MutS family protein n=1 Tax=Paracoccus caeni TaxID=657651 RepID=A0A934SLW0_9RHOB|nr:Smr/MutS family protein [Paracoccus caeni]MBK4217612.1 Smr/MutS family protein [Paracoccus caeni]
MARRRRGLTPEERDLWSRVARSATPLHPEKPKGSEPVEISSSPLPKPPAVRTSVPHFDIGQSTALPIPDYGRPSPSPAQRLAAQPLRMDQKVHRRMSQGKLKPEARLDLHGMTLAAAQPELIRFILSCHASGRRLVLVITGKGRGDHGPLPTRPGALRHQVPFWLQSAPLSQVVQQISAAHFRHGGEGAYYVYLRRLQD